MGVAAHHDPLLDAGEDRPPTFLGCESGEHLLVVPGRAMAEEDGPEAVHLDYRALRKRSEEIPLLAVDTAGGPDGRWPRLGAIERFDHPAVRVAADEHGRPLK
jgi:hypothetical protein